MINGFLPFLHIGVAFNKSFIFPQLKNTSENECNFSEEERTRKNEHGFSFWKHIRSLGDVFKHIRSLGDVLLPPQMKIWKIIWLY